MRVAGKLFVIEGTDGSGKSTQFALLCRALSDRGVRFRAVTFPRYSEDSSVPVRLYLSGKLGERPDDVGPYAASSFFAIDRYISYKTDWMRDYQAGVPILCDRYTTSNAVHQAAKLSGDERDRYLDWLFDYEYRLLGIPAPDEVFFLDMPSELALDLLHRRQGENGDIHEKDPAYLSRCRESALYVCRRFGWTAVPCAAQGKLLPPEQIGAQIAERVLRRLEAREEASLNEHVQTHEDGKIC